MVDQPERLRVVDDDEVILVGELPRVELLIAAEDLLVRLAEAVRIALQRVVDHLGDVEEIFCAANDPPLDLEPGILHERDEGVVDLRDAAAERGRRDVENPLAGQRLGQRADLAHQAARRQRGVVAQRLVADVDELEQAVALGGEGLGEA